MFNIALESRWGFMHWHTVDQLIECAPGESGSAVITFAADEKFFLDHFPGNPLVPAVLLIEIMAKTGGLVTRAALPVFWPLLPTPSSPLRCAREINV